MYSWRAFDTFQPNFRHLLSALAERRPAEGITAAEALLAKPTHPLAHAFDALVMTATKSDPIVRLRLISVAAKSAGEDLQAAAVACCSWWRHEGELPDAAWQLLELSRADSPNAHRKRHREFRLVARRTSYFARLAPCYRAALFARPDEARRSHRRPRGGYDQQCRAAT